MDIQLFVEVLLVEIVEPLPALLEPNDKQPKVLQVEGFQDDFHWSDVSSDDDENVDGGGNVHDDLDGDGEVHAEVHVDGDGDGDVDVDGGRDVHVDVNNDEEVHAEVDGESNLFQEDNVVGDNESEDVAESGAILSNFEHNSEEMGESGNDDVVSRMSRNIKQNEFKYRANGKINFKVTNPGSMTKLRVIREIVPPTSKFKRFFLSFAAQKKGFLYGSRHFIGIDGCHLKVHYGRVLLLVVSMDANSGVFPLAICIYEVENNDSWGFFLSVLHDFLGDVDDVTFMRDRQKGVHLRNLFWGVSRASNRLDFIAAIGKVREVDEDAYKQILQNKPDKWSLYSFDPVAKSNHLTNNMSEVFNAWLGKDRELPILSLLELCRIRISRVPCVHVVSYLLHMNVNNFEEHVDDKLRITTYMQTYAHMIHLVPDKSTCPDVSGKKLWPPYKHAKSSRPAKARKKIQLRNPTIKGSTHLDVVFAMEWAITKDLARRIELLQIKGKAIRTYVATMTIVASRARFAASSTNAASSSQNNAPQSHSTGGSKHIKFHTVIRPNI
ncbi:hypothetical protein Pint_25989 [Pistacia integerrima]|uniref:Uncharacterized protein n=1 Tax=Pistacia integerrima TaxID=434235 RepID=A0ACC0YB67_9ROSI|nr:hypothetical protein Pint_25989 [Pistacia integerrima]